MAINSTFYLDAADLTLATSVYLDSTLLNLAPDGFYSDGTISREQSSGILLTAETCTSCSECVCYTVTWLQPTTEPWFGFTNFDYKNCAGTIIEATVSEFGPPMNICAQVGYSIRIDTSTPNDESIDVSDAVEDCCGGCINYEATGTGTLTYIDCNGEPQNYDMTSETLIFCAQEGSPSYTIGITLTNNGSCNIVCREYHIDGEGSATFMDCFGNPGQAFSNEFFCAANGTVFGSGSIGIITPNTCA